MDDRDKSFEGNRFNDLEQQREEVAAGAQIEATEEQRVEQYRQAMNAANAENATGAGNEAAGRQPMTEAEAKALLLEETRKTEQKLEKAHKNNRKGIIIAIIVAVVLCAVGVVLALTLGGKDGEKKAVDDLPEVTTGAEMLEEAEDELVALDLDDEVVQKLYGNMKNVGGAYSSTLDFYTDKNVQRGEVSKMMMLDIALGNAAVQGGECRAKHYLEVGEESYEVGELFGCREGKEAQEKIREIFGVVIELDDGDTTGEYCGAWKYDALNDEFYVPAMGCGGACLYGLTRELTKAEQDKDNIYLYETVYGGHCQNLTLVDGTVIAEREYDDNGNLIKDFDIEDYRDQLEQFKWTFTKNDDGEYIFTGLEKVK